MIYLAENALPEYIYTTLEEFLGTEEAQVRTEREARIETAVRVWGKQEAVGWTKRKNCSKEVPVEKRTRG